MAELLTSSSPRGGGGLRVVWDCAEAAEAIAGIPARGPLPLRTVVAPSARVAHALRKELASAGLHRVLAGTTFVTPVDAATEVLRGAGIDFEDGEDARRAMRLASMFQGDLGLAYFQREALRDAAGWAEAFGRTLGALERAGLRPDDVRAAGTEARWADVARVWAALDEAAGRSWTRARVVGEAAAVLAADATAWPWQGAALVLLFPDFDAVEARLARAIGGGSVAMFGARPHRSAHVARVRALLGDAAAAAVVASAPGVRAATERDVLASFLFEAPQRLADPKRPRSAGIDGSVQLEEHAGVEAEVEAATEWVSRLILEHRTPLEEIAILAPRLDPLASLVVERLRRLPWAEGTLPVFVAGGLPLSGTAAGARALAVVRALRAHLGVEEVAGVLPALRLADDATRRRLSRDRAVALAYSLGTAGGSAGDGVRALEWGPRARDRESALAARFAALPENAERRVRREVEEQLADLRAVRPALEALVGLAERALDDVALVELGAAVAGFLDTWVLAPGTGAAPIGALLAEALEGLCSGGAGAQVRGDSALEAIERALLSLRGTTGRFGDPAVYVGALEGACGLSFAAVRVIGLAEGHCPSAPREDAVLPEALGERLAARGLRGAGDRALAQIHALDMAVQGARFQLVLSFARLDVDRSNREPSSIYVEAAAALGRADASGARPTIPGARALRREGFAPARAAGEKFRRAGPLAASSWLSRVALGDGAPAAWAIDGHLDLGRMRAIAASDGWGPLDGLIGPAATALELPGLTAAMPISASALRTLLECPHRFLLQRVLGWDEPAAGVPTREIDALRYGTLFHSTLEAFANAHGDGFGERRDSLEAWCERGEVVARQAFDELLETYPLVGEAVRAQQRGRLRKDVRRFLEAEWSAAPRQLVAAEHAFGYDAPEVLDAGGVPLHVRGRIDRIDREGEYLLVRDLKTGRCHPREGKVHAPQPKLDVQIALYGMVARRMAAERGLRVGAAYVYSGAVRQRERAFREDFGALEAAAAGWLELAASLLVARAFPRSPDADDCVFCAFRPVCGVGASARAAALLEPTGDGPLHAFRRLKGKSEVAA